MKQEIFEKATELNRRIDELKRVKASMEEAKNAKYWNITPTISSRGETLRTFSLSDNDMMEQIIKLFEENIERTKEEFERL